MKVIITESQYSLIIEQSDYMMDKRGNALLNATGIRSDKDYKDTNNSINKSQQGVAIDQHTLLTILSIGTAFIPIAGPFISAGIVMGDAALYYKEGDKKSAGITALFSILPFISKIPGVKQLGSKGMSLIANKLLNGGKNLTKAELEIVNSVKIYEPHIQQELTKMAPKLKSIVNELQIHKVNYIKKYGETKYTNLLTEFLYDGIKKEQFIATLKGVKNPTIKIKPILGSGADHRVFQSAVRPDRIIKAELRPGEVDKWYDLFNRNQKVFAKTFSKTKVKNTDGTMLSAVVMEKLNTQPFIQLWDSMEKSLYNMPNSPNVPLEYVSKHIDNPTYRNIWNNFLKYSKKQQPSISNKIDEFSKMVNELYKITPKPDIRKYNLGYDSNGILKALDI